MKNIAAAQFFLRLALGIGFMLPVMDRFGWLGAPGAPHVGWGDWDHFAGYSHSLTPFLNASWANLAAILATGGEAVFGVCLIIGFKTRVMAYGSFILTLFFAVCMFFFADYRAPFNFSVFTDSAAALLLARIPNYRWSVDAMRE